MTGLVRRMGEITTYADNVTDFYMESYSDYTVTLEELCESSHSQALLIKVVQLCIFSVVFLVGILGNMLVIATFALYRRLRLRCMTDVFLLHLAVSDLLLLLTLPLQAADTLLDRWEFGSILCKVMRGLYAVNTYSGLLLLACISVDRYVVIVQTRAAQRLRHYHLLYSSLAAICVWFTAGLLSLPEIISVGVDTQKLEQRCEHQLEWKIKIATWATQIAGFCLPFLAMLVCYSLIGRTLLQGQGWRRQRTLRLLLVLVLVFLVFQLPYTIVLSLKMAKNSHNNPGNACEHWKATLIAEYITCSLAYMRCCLNPLLYALVGVRFRNDVLRLLHDAGCIRWGPCGRSLVSASDSCVSTSATSPLPTVKSVMGSTSEQLLSPAPSIQMNFTTSPVY